MRHPWISVADKLRRLFSNTTELPRLLIAFIHNTFLLTFFPFPLSTSHHLVSRLVAELYKSLSRGIVIIRATAVHQTELNLGKGEANLLLQSLKFH